MIKFRILFILTALLVGVELSSAQRVKFAVGVDGGYSCSKLDYTSLYEEGDTHRTWDIGLQGEARVRVLSFLQANTILNLNYNDVTRRYMAPLEGGSEIGYNTKKLGGFAIQLTEYFNFKIWKGIGIGTGPGVKFSTDEAFISSSKWRAYWAFGVDKDFGPITARVTWQQLLHSSDIYNSMLNFAVLYRF